MQGDPTDDIRTDRKDPELTGQDLALPDWPGADWSGALARARAHAPHLAALLERLPDLADLLAGGDLGAALEHARQAGSGAADVASALRREKQALALALAIGDLAGALPLLGVTGALSDLADRALDAAIADAIRRRVPDCAARADFWRWRWASMARASLTTARTSIRSCCSIRHCCPAANAMSRAKPRSA